MHWPAKKGQQCLLLAPSMKSIPYQNSYLQPDEAWKSHTKLVVKNCVQTKIYKCTYKIHIYTMGVTYTDINNKHIHMYAYFHIHVHTMCVLQLSVSLYTTYIVCIELLTRWYSANPFNKGRTINIFVYSRNAYLQNIECIAGQVGRLTAGASWLYIEIVDE